MRYLEFTDDYFQDQKDEDDWYRRNELKMLKGLISPGIKRCGQGCEKTCRYCHEDVRKGIDFFIEGEKNGKVGEPIAG